MAGCENNRMEPTSAQFDPEMEDKDGQNPIQASKIFAAADARNRAETITISAREVTTCVGWLRVPFRCRGNRVKSGENRYSPYGISTGFSMRSDASAHIPESR
jgi:hypothetical protein